MMVRARRMMEEIKAVWSEESMASRVDLAGVPTKSMPVTTLSESVRGRYEPKKS
jgi:hypothetical protein